MTGDEKLRQQWEEIDFDSVGLWRHLLRYDYRRAAMGLLQDLLKELHDGEETQRENLELGNSEMLPDGETMDENLVALYRKRLMQVLDDADGQHLEEWKRLYEEYRYQGFDHERDTVLNSPFLGQAMKLVLVMGNRLKAKEAEE